MHALFNTHACDAARSSKRRGIVPPHLPPIAIPHFFSFLKGQGPRGQEANSGSLRASPLQTVLFNSDV